MSSIERCRRMAGCMAYARESRPARDWYDRALGWAMPAVVVWGVLAFCVTLIASRHWAF